MNKFADKLMDKIKKENIKPIPLWRFILKNVVLWSFFAISVLIGAITFSVIIFSLSYEEIELMPHIRDHMNLLLHILPLFWILILIILLFASILFIKKTKTGYRHSSIKIILLSLILSMFFGGIIHAVNMSEKMEHILCRTIPYAESIQDRRMNRWTMAEEGFLAGKVIKIEKDYLLLKDFNEKEWKIYNVKNIHEDEIIRIIGKIKSENEFMAIEVLPKNPTMNRFFEKHHSSCMMNGDEDCPLTPQRSRQRGVNSLPF